MNNPELKIVKNPDEATEPAVNENAMNSTDTSTENPAKEIVNPMEFMSKEEVDAENAKAEEFFKALRFGTGNFFRKIKEVYEQEGIIGLQRLERSLDAYMAIRTHVIEEVIQSDIARESETKRQLERDHKNPESDTTDASTKVDHDR